jgi:hypothetical protein
MADINVDIKSDASASVSLARVFLMADSSILDGNRWPQWGSFVD